MNITGIEGIGPVYAQQLGAVGITTTELLLERAATAQGRASLTDQVGISERVLLEWVNHADLMRISGVGSQYSDLLEAAGVDSASELAQRNAGNLVRTFHELDAARPDTVRRIPSERMVAGWIDQASRLPKIVTH